MFQAIGIRVSHIVLRVSENTDARIITESMA